MGRHETRVDLAPIEPTLKKSGQHEQANLRHDHEDSPRPLEVLGEHAAVLASDEATIGSELFLKEGSF